MNNDSITFETPLLRGRFQVFNDIPHFDFLKVKQTHSNLTYHESKCQAIIEADGILGESSIPKAILTADCLPIVLLSKNQHCVIHAGWKGLANEILLSQVIIDMNPLYAFIGPHIREENYEVQEDFKTHFPKHLDAFKKTNNRTTFNMALVAHKQLKSLFPQIVIEDCGLCTFSEEKFHSFRRNQTTKRNYNIYLP